MFPNWLANTHVYLPIMVLYLIHLKLWKLMLKKALAANRLSLPLGGDINGQRKGLSSLQPFTNPLLCLNVLHNFLKYPSRKVGYWFYISGREWPEVLHISSPYIVHTSIIFLAFGYWLEAFCTLQWDIVRYAWSIHHKGWAFFVEWRSLG